MLVLEAEQAERSRASRVRGSLACIKNMYDVLFIQMLLLSARIDCNQQIPPTAIPARGIAARKNTM